MLIAWRYCETSKENPALRCRSFRDPTTMPSIIIRPRTSPAWVQQPAPAGAAAAALGCIVVAAAAAWRTTWDIRVSPGRGRGSSGWTGGRARENGLEGKGTDGRTDERFSLRPRRRATKGQRLRNINSITNRDRSGQA